MTGLIKPCFEEGEFRCFASHYKIESLSGPIYYAYIRKNACSAFRALINERKHPVYDLKQRLGIPMRPFSDIGGNMSYFRVSERKVYRSNQGGLCIFVYRNPIDRFISVFLNKFVNGKGATDIAESFERASGSAVTQASMLDFMEYASAPFLDLDCHIWPQKSHLWDVWYKPICLENLHSEMVFLIGREKADRVFLKKTNESVLSNSYSTKTDLTEVKVEELRRMKDHGVPIGRDNFVSKALRDFVNRRYFMDFDLIDRIRLLA